MKTILIIGLVVIILLISSYILLIGNIDKTEPHIVKLNEPIKLIGVEINTTDKDIYKDVGQVASEFNRIKKNCPVPYLKQPWESVNISKDYNVEAKTFKYIVGDVVTQVDSIPEGLCYYEIPAITYAVFPIRPKSRIAWGITMGRMKKYIYTQWLPKSGHRPSEIIGDFELHDEKSLKKNPEISLYVALKENKTWEN
jgi:predicted transcriptional regulator YdeE